MNLLIGNLVPVTLKLTPKPFGIRQLKKKRWYKVSGSALQNEHRSSVLKPILCSFELVYKIELGTLN